MKNFIITKPKPLIHGVHFVPLLNFEIMNICKQLIVKHNGINTLVRSFNEAVKLDEGLLYLEKCLNPLPFGFIYDDSFKSALIGDLSKGLDWSDYWQAYDEII